MCFCPGNVLRPRISVAAFYSNPFCTVNPVHAAAGFHPLLPVSCGSALLQAQRLTSVPLQLAEGGPFLNQGSEGDRQRSVHGARGQALPPSRAGNLLPRPKTVFLCVLHCSLNVTALSGPQRTVLTASTALIYQTVRMDDCPVPVKQRLPFLAALGVGMRLDVHFGLKYS